MFSLAPPFGRAQDFNQLALGPKSVNPENLFQVRPRYFVQP